jgi:RNA polymerase sigma-70 factor (ECF subfamily)
MTESMSKRGRKKIHNNEKFNIILKKIEKVQNKINNLLFTVQNEYPQKYDEVINNVLNFVKTPILNNSTKELKKRGRKKKIVDNIQEIVKIPKKRGRKKIIIDEFEQLLSKYNKFKFEPKKNKVISIIESKFPDRKQEFFNRCKIENKIFTPILTEPKVLKKRGRKKKIILEVNNKVEHKKRGRKKKVIDEFQQLIDKYNKFKFDSKKDKVISIIESKFPDRKQEFFDNCNIKIELKKENIIKSNNLDEFDELIDKYNSLEKDNIRTKILKIILSKYYHKKDLFFESINNIYPRSYNKILINLGLKDKKKRGRHKKYDLEISSSDKINKDDKFLTIDCDNNEIKSFPNNENEFENIYNLKNDLNNNEKLFFELTKKRFIDFYNHYRTRLIYYMFQFTKDMDKAQDFTEDAFIQCLSKINQFDSSKSQIHTWLYSIAENMVKKDWKDKQKVNVFSLETEIGETSNLYDLLPIENDSEKFEQQNEINEKARLLRDEIKKLPKKYQEVLTMRELDGLQYQDIAEILDTNLSTIKSRIKKGRELVIHKVQKKFNIIDKYGLK